MAIAEVSEGKALYVEDPYDEKEWCDKIVIHQHDKLQQYDFPEYGLEEIAGRYLNLFNAIANGGN